MEGEVGNIFALIFQKLLYFSGNFSHKDRIKHSVKRIHDFILFHLVGHGCFLVHKMTLCRVTITGLWWIVESLLWKSSLYSTNIKSEIHAPVKKSNGCVFTMCPAVKLGPNCLGQMRLPELLKISWVKHVLVKNLWVNSHEEALSHTWEWFHSSPYTREARKSPKRTMSKVMLIRWLTLNDYKGFNCNNSKCIYPAPISQLALFQANLPGSLKTGGFLQRWKLNSYLGSTL